MSNLSPQQFPIERVLAMQSKDYDVPMHAVEPHLRAADAQQGRPAVDIWVNHMRDHGIREPIHVEGARPVGEFSLPDTVRDGHHRVVAARLAGMTHVPVVYHTPQQDKNGSWRYPSLEVD